MKKIKVLVIEDNRLLREAITEMLNEETDIDATSSSGTLGDTLEIVEAFKPKVALLDLGLEDTDSLELVDQIKIKFPKIHIIVMDIIPANPEIAEYVNAGVSGFILKDATLEDFLQTIRLVFKGTKILPPKMTESLFEQIIEYTLKKGKNTLLTNSVQLTHREKEILNLIAEGCSNKDISQELNIAIHTVKSHVHNTLEKLTLQTRLQLAHFVHTNQNLDNLENL